MFSQVFYNMEINKKTKRLLSQGEKMTIYYDYPKERPDLLSSNKDMVCFFCKKPAKEINDTLEGHAPDCKYRVNKQPQHS